MAAGRRRGLNDLKLYVAIGDSATEGLFDPDGNGGNRGWADRLAEHLARQNPGMHYANLAVRGRRTHEILEEQLEPGLALGPDLVSVVAGMNDVLRPSLDLEQVIDDIDAMVSACRAAGSEVITCTFGDPVPINPYARVLRRRINALNAGVREVTARHGAVLADIATEPCVSDPRFWCEDRLHANTEGHIRIAAAMAEALGLQLEGPPWNVPLPAAERQRRREAFTREIVWARRYLWPWVVRRIRKVSSGDGVAAKRPQPLPVEVQPPR
jgi:lysophospholipase L1-like esterase